MVGFQSHFEVKNFMQSLEFKWFEACMELIDIMPDENLTYESLLDGVLIHRLFCRMNICVKKDNIKLPNGDKSIRRHNLKIILNNIQHYYELEMNYLIIKIPNIERLIKDPEHNTDEVTCLLNLLIGCAQLCPEKEDFAEIVNKLQCHNNDSTHQFTPTTLKLANYVFHCKMLMLDEPSERESNAKKIFDYIRDLHIERDVFKEFIRQRCILSTTNNSDDTEDLEFSLRDVHCALNNVKFNNPISDYSDELSRVKDQERALRIQVNLLKVKLHRVSVSANELKAKNDELKSMNRNLKLKAKEAQYEVAEMLSFEASKVKNLMSHNTQLMYKVEEMSSYKRQAEYLHDQNEKLLDANEESDSRYVKFREQSDRHIKDLMSENNKLKNKLKKQRKKSSSMPSTNDSLNEDEDLNNNTDIYFDDSLEISNNLQNALIKNLDLESKLETAQIELAQQKAKINSLKLVARDFEIKKKELAKLNTEADRLRLELAKVSDERERLLWKYQSLKKKHRQIEERNNVVENDLQRSQAHLIDFQKQASDLEIRCKEYKQSQEELIKEKKKLMDCNDELRRKNKEYEDKWMVDFKNCQIERDALIRTKERLEQKIIDQFQDMQDLVVMRNTKKVRGKRVREVLEMIRRHSASIFLRGRSNECGDEASSTFAFTRTDKNAPGGYGLDDKESDFITASVFFNNVENNVEGKIKIEDKINACRQHSDQKVHGVENKDASKFTNKRMSDVLSNYFGKASQKFWKEEPHANLTPIESDLPMVVNCSNFNNENYKIQDCDSSSNINRRPPMPLPIQRRPLPNLPIRVER